MRYFKPESGLFYGIQAKKDFPARPVLRLRRSAWMAITLFWH
jgi:hypothetical protein